MGGWGLHSHFHVQPNCSVEVEVVLRCRWGCDNENNKDNEVCDESTEEGKGKTRLNINQCNQIIKCRHLILMSGKNINSSFLKHFTKMAANCPLP